MQHEAFMRLALTEAARAATHDEVPVGAVVVVDDQVIAAAHNQNITLHDPSAHAEILALRQAAQHVGNHRLLGARLYVTLEPCLMCVGALVHARIAEVIFGTLDPKTGACGSCVDAHEFIFHNHRVHVQGGILAAESALLLKEFFKMKRYTKDT
jgi:tRNA(adenine34) deaminase